MPELDLVAAVDKHAIDNYEKGWDLWIECLDTAEKVEAIGEATNAAEAIKNATVKVAPMVEAQAIRAENCALYDTGEAADLEFYNQLQENAENFGKKKFTKSLQRT